MARAALLGGEAPIAGIVVEHDDALHVVLSARALWADAATLRILIAEAARALVGQGDPADAPLQYPDYVRWLDELGGQHDARPGLEFWQQVLRHSPAEVDCSLNPETSCSPARLEAWLAPEVWGAVRAFARSAEVTLEAPLLAAWRAAMGDGSRGERAVGVRLAGRDFSEVNDLVGPLAQVVPIAFALDPTRSFAEVAVAADRQITAAREWLECWSAGMGREVEPPRVQLELRLAAEDAGTELSVIDEYEDDGAPPLALRCVERDRRLHCALSFDDTYVSREHASFLVERFTTILGCAVAAPGVPLGRIRQIGPRERDAVTRRFAGSPVPQADAVSVLSELRAVVEANPAAAAVHCDDVVITYRALADHARRIATLLLARGARPGDHVLVMFRRTADLAAGILGTMLAGCAYVPLDPDHPRARLAQIADATGARCILAQRATAHAAAGLAPELLLVDDEALLTGAALAPWFEPARGDAAYVIFTSGSTGQPKGVVVTHGNLTASTRARRDFFGGGHARSLLLYSYAFDSSIAPIFGTLCSGGLLVIARDGSQQDPRAIGELVSRHAITHLYCNPNVWRLVLQEVPESSLGSLEAVVAGEACTPALVSRHFEAAAETRMVNEYGPTESTVWCTSHTVVAQDASSTRVPIGRPIASSRIHVLDDRLEPVALGVAGQLFVGGEGVALGYLGDPRLTAAGFVPDPFSVIAGARMYATGARARWLPDGRLEFLGRIDQQLKIRGYRVDPLEIEAALARIEGVEEAAVGAKDVQAAFRQRRSEPAGER